MQPNLLQLSIRKLIKSHEIASNVNIDEINICSFDDIIQQAEHQSKLIFQLYDT
jgi:hypothetical protein